MCLTVYSLWCAIMDISSSFFFTSNMIIKQDTYNLLLQRAFSVVLTTRSRPALNIMYTHSVGIHLTLLYRYLSLLILIYVYYSLSSCVYCAYFTTISMVFFDGLSRSFRPTHAHNIINNNILLFRVINIKILYARSVKITRRDFHYGGLILPKISFP